MEKDERDYVLDLPQNSQSATQSARPIPPHNIK